MAYLINKFLFIPHSINNNNCKLIRTKIMGAIKAAVEKNIHFITKEK